MPNSVDVVYDTLAAAGLVTSCPTTEQYDPPLELESGDVLAIAERVVAALGSAASDPTTHIAADHVLIDDRWLRQRCAWCGVILLDYDLHRTAAPIDQPGPPATWPRGALLRIDGNASWTVDADRLPDDACTREVTGRG